MSDREDHHAEVDALQEERDAWKARCEKAEGERDAMIQALLPCAGITATSDEIAGPELAGMVAGAYLGARAERDGLAGRVGECERALRGLFNRDDHNCDNEVIGGPVPCGRCPLCMAKEALGGGGAIVEGQPSRIVQMSEPLRDFAPANAPAPFIQFRTEPIVEAHNFKSMEAAAQRRTLACHGACEGIPTERLEGIARDFRLSSIMVLPTPNPDGKPERVEIVWRQRET